MINILFWIILPYQLPPIWESIIGKYQIDEGKNVLGFHWKSVNAYITIQNKAEFSNSNVATTITTTP